MPYRDAVHVEEFTSVDSFVHGQGAGIEMALIGPRSICAFVHCQLPTHLESSHCIGSVLSRTENNPGLRLCTVALVFEANDDCLQGDCAQRAESFWHVLFGIHFKFERILKDYIGDRSGVS